MTFVAEHHFPKNLTIRAPNNAQKGNLAADLNYARFYLTSLLPGVEKVVYLDADTIVNKDISKLYDSALKDSDAVLAAVPRDGKDVCYSLIDCEDPVIAQVLKEEGFPNPATDLNFFNAGASAVPSIHPLDRRVDPRGASTLTLASPGTRRRRTRSPRWRRAHDHVTRRRRRLPLG